MTGKTGPTAPPGDGTVGNRILVNGEFAPHLNVATHRYRLRLLNSSNFQSYDFALSDGRPFVQIGTGSDLLPRPVVRAEHPARAGATSRRDRRLPRRAAHERRSREHHGHPQRAGRDRDTDRVDHAVPGHPQSDRPHPDPVHARSPASDQGPEEASMTWTFGLGGDAATGTYWTVNGKPFDPHRVDVEVPLGATQTWLLKTSARSPTTSTCTKRSGTPSRSTARSRRHGSEASRTPGGSTPERPSKSPRSSPTTPASSCSTATCSTTRTTG